EGQKRSFNDKRSLHVVVPGAADNIAFHTELTLLPGSNLDGGGFTGLDGLIDIKSLDAEAMLYVLGGHLQDGWLSLFEPDGIRVDVVSFHYDLDGERFNGLCFA